MMKTNCLNQAVLFHLASREKKRKYCDVMLNSCLMIHKLFVFLLPAEWGSFAHGWPKLATVRVENHSTWRHVCQHNPSGRFKSSQNMWDQVKAFNAESTCSIRGQCFREGDHFWVNWALSWFFLTFSTSFLHLCIFSSLKKRKNDSPLPAIR